MSAAWALQALLVGALLGAGALAAERVAGWFGVPRRGVWAAALLGSLLLPALSLWRPDLLPDPGLLPGARGLVSTPQDGVLSLPFRTTGAVPQVPGAGAPKPDLATVLGLVWVAASLGGLATVAWTYVRLRALRARCTPVRVDGVAVRLADRMAPAVIGLLHPVVVVPRWVLDAPAEERRLILLHEREHLARGDGWLLFLGALAVAAMPWSLPLWWQHLRLRVAVETDCDARVLARGANRRTYGQVLIRTAGSTPGLSPLVAAWGGATSQLERRIMAMTAKRPSHRGLRSVPLVVLAAGVIVAACDVAGDSRPEAEPEVTGVPAPAAARTPSTHGGVTWSADGKGADTVHVHRVPDPNAGELGFGPRFRGPIRVVAGVRPTRWPNYPDVHSVRQGSSAARAGLRVGDEILAINGNDAREMAAWAPLRPRVPGTRYVLSIRRGASEHEIHAEIGPPAGR